MSARPGRPPLFKLPYLEWMDSAACKGKDPAIFFPRDGHHLLPRPAVEVCNFCPVQLSCLKYALDYNIDDGVWGGTTRNDRRRIRRARAKRLRLAEAPESPPQSSYG